MSTILIVLLVLLLIGAIGGLPNWGIHQYGWGPSGGIVGILLIVLLVLLLTGRL